MPYVAISRVEKLIGLHFHDIKYRNKDGEIIELKAINKNAFKINKELAKIIDPWREKNGLKTFYDDIEIDNDELNQIEKFREFIYNSFYSMNYETDSDDSCENENINKSKIKLKEKNHKKITYTPELLLTIIKK